jgi:hypothetical protein
LTWLTKSLREVKLASGERLFKAQTLPVGMKAENSIIRMKLIDKIDRVGLSAITILPRHPMVPITK